MINVLVQAETRSSGLIDLHARTTSENPGLSVRYPQRSAEVIAGLSFLSPTPPRRTFLMLPRVRVGLTFHGVPCEIGLNFDAKTFSMKRWQIHQKSWRPTFTGRTCKDSRPFANTSHRRRRRVSQMSGRGLHSYPGLQIPVPA